jgi:ubiquinone/menaquinone biosynthesis C-methylase UbiE
MLTDKEIITKYKLKPTDKILDIGGSMKQHTDINIDTLVDIVHPKDAPYYPSKLRAKHFVKVDIQSNKLPFKNKQFDFCLCTHTIEDLSWPFLALDEMARVSKRGLITTPSRGEDMVFTQFDITNWMTGGRRVPGVGHHKWFFEKRGKTLYVITKNYPLLYSGEFQFTKWNGPEECRYYWSDDVKYKVAQEIDFHLLIKEYREFVEKNRKYLTKESVLIYFDKPFVILKQWLKLLLKRGKGFE